MARMPRHSASTTINSTRSVRFIHQPDAGDPKFLTFRLGLGTAAEELHRAVRQETRRRAAPALPLIHCAVVDAVVGAEATPPKGALAAAAAPHRPPC